MDALPQVGQKYQHKKWGEVEVFGVLKIGRGYRVHCWEEKFPITREREQRLRDFQRDTR